MAALRLSNDFTLPAEAVTETFAIPVVGAVREPPSGVSPTWRSNWPAMHLR
jgi:hypothetical protein